MDTANTKETTVSRYAQINENDVQDPAGIPFRTGQLVCDGDPEFATNYGRVLGFIELDLGQYPGIIVAWENPEVGEDRHTGMQDSMFSPHFVEDVYVATAARNA